MNRYLGHVTHDWTGMGDKKTRYGGQKGGGQEGKKSKAINFLIELETIVLKKKRGKENTKTKKKKKKENMWGGKEKDI